MLSIPNSTFLPNFIRMASIFVFTKKKHPFKYYRQFTFFFYYLKNYVIAEFQQGTTSTYYSIYQKPIFSLHLIKTNFHIKKNVWTYFIPNSLRKDNIFNKFRKDNFYTIDFIGHITDFRYLQKKNTLSPKKQTAQTAQIPCYK